ncbi:MAG TPA: DUF5666 domain-containing protein [Candidatus Acidoferrum sp.]
MRCSQNKLTTVGCASGLVAFLAFAFLVAAQQPTPGVTRVVGTIQSISGKSLTILSDSGTVSPVAIEDATKILQIEPGKTDLKEATPITLGDLQLGDRVLVRGILADDGKTVRAASLVAVKKAALAEKQARERTEWQHGVGGLVKSIDPQAFIITITTNSIGTNKEVSIHFTKDAVLRRYASDSTRFDAAKPGPLTEIQPGDQLRARGTRSESGTEFNAVEIVSGTFRSIAATVISTGVADSSLVVLDLATKSPVTLKINGESQMRKLPVQFAEGLAARLKNQSAPGGSAPPAADAAPSQGQSPQQGTAPGAAPAGRGGGDFQQMIARMPAATISDLQKNDAVMVVTTQGNGKDPLTVVTLLAGVEPILRSSPKGSRDMILSPWSLGGGEPSGN